jgi:hypothetical protein
MDSPVKPENDGIAFFMQFFKGPKFTYGAGNGTRTRDNHVGNVRLYHLSYSRVCLFINELKPLCQ